MTPPSSEQGTISLLGRTYAVGFTLPASRGGDYTSESHEWVTGKETVENWTSLITTHLLTPSDSGTPLSAQAYAENAAALQEGNGATIFETSVINTADAAAEGIDTKNPPYLIVYAFLPQAPGGPVEIDLQRITDAGGGRVAVFIYAERRPFAGQDELEAYLNSDAFTAKRTAVLKATVPR